MADDDSRSCGSSSQLIRGRTFVRLASIGGEDSSALLSITPAQEGTPEQIEKAIKLRETREALKEDEWLVCHLKVQGYSAKEIGRQPRQLIVSRKHGILARDPEAPPKEAQHVGAWSGEMRASKPPPRPDSCTTAETEKVDGE